MLTLGIESSCDETSAAVVDNGHIILSNIIASQHDIHASYGGVVPELASRRHLENISVVVREALDRAGVSISEIDLTAVTSGPGLIVALLVGLSFAKGLAYAIEKPLVGVNHLEGHILSVFLEKPILKFPFISLLVSGGHTDLYVVRDFGDYTLLGHTLDDAAGEALDKGAKMLGLKYPGGPEIEREALKGDPCSVKLPHTYLGKNSLDFSFSGLKTALKNYLKKQEESSLNKEIPNIAASYQSAIIEVLTHKAISAAKRENVRSIVICGGVASNHTLRKMLLMKASREGIVSFYPSPRLCTDNAAMIACAGYNRFIKNPKQYEDFVALDADPGMKL